MTVQLRSDSMTRCYTTASFVTLTMILHICLYSATSALLLSGTPSAKRRNLSISPLRAHRSPETTESSSSAPLSPPSRPSTSLPHRRSKKKKQKKKKGPKQQNVARTKTSSLSSGEVLSEHDLAEHVSNLYIHGPGGVLRHRSRSHHGAHHHHHHHDHPEQKQFLQSLERHPALVLNADYQPMSYLPLSLWHWQEAVKAIFSGKVTVVDVYPDVTIRAASLEIPLPSVIALNEYVPPKLLYQQKPAFTKRNVFLRDEYRCQYCSLRFHTRDLSLDHVVPRCRGGRLHWENAVTCCRTCNGRKGSLELSELRSVGMKLRKEPVVPTQYELARVAGRMLPRRVHPTWEPYLGLHSSMPSSKSKKQGESSGKSRSTGASGGEEAAVL